MHRHLPTLASTVDRPRHPPGHPPRPSLNAICRDRANSHVIRLLLNDRKTCPRFHPTCPHRCLFTESASNTSTRHQAAQHLFHCRFVTAVDKRLPSPRDTTPQIPCPSSGPRAAFLAFCTTMYVYLSLTRGHASTADPSTVGRELGDLRVHRKHRPQAS